MNEHDRTEIRALILEVLREGEGQKRILESVRPILMAIRDGEARAMSGIETGLGIRPLTADLRQNEKDKTPSASRGMASAIANPSPRSSKLTGFLIPMGTVQFLTDHELLGNRIEIRGDALVACDAQNNEVARLPWENLGQFAWMLMRDSLSKAAP